jgi:two-component system, OmpR family, response regulator
MTCIVASKTDDVVDNPQFHVLLIDDDTALATVVIKELEKRNYIVSHAPDSGDAVARMGERHFDILILDRMLPGADGISLIEIFRSHNSSSPILVISALDHVDERVFGLQSGADDYLIKPFSYAELGARVDALLRRSSLHPLTKLQVGSLTLDLLKRVAFLFEEEIDLSVREFELLEYFMARPGQLVTKQMLLQNVWKYRFPVETNVVDVHLSKLRQKIERKDGPRFIRNVRAQGYVFGADV